MKVLVIGGTGTVGSGVAAGLAERGVGVRVMTRKPDSASGPAGVEYVYGDLEDPASLGAPFEGIDRAFLLTPLHQREADLGRAAVAAAREAGIEHLAFMSVHRVEKGAHIPHFGSKIEIEEAIREAGIDHTVVYPGSFFQNDLRYRTAVMEHGVYPEPFGPVGVSRCDTRDISEMVVNALTDERPAGGGYPVVGPDVLTGEDCAAAYARHLDREVRYAGDDLDAWAAQVGGMMPDWLVKDLRIMYEHFQEHGLKASEDDFDRQRELLRREPRTYDDFVAELTDAWRS